VFQPKRDTSTILIRIEKLRRLERVFEAEEEDFQSDGGLSKNRKIKRNHLTKHFFLFSSLFSIRIHMLSRLISFVLSICVEFVNIDLGVY